METKSVKRTSKSTDVNATLLRYGFSQVHFMLIYIVLGFITIALVEFIRTNYFPAATGSLVFESLAGIIFLALSAPLISSAIAQYKKQNSSLKKDHDFLLNNISFGIIQAHLNGKIVKTNPAACELLEYTEDELISGGTELFIPEKDKILSALTAEGSLTPTSVIMTTLTANGGKLIPVEIVSTIYTHDDDEKYMSLILRDRRRELEVENVERRVMLVLNGVTTPLMIADHDWNVVWFNAAAVEIAGNPLEKVVGNRVMTLNRLLISDRERAFIKSSVAKKGVWSGIVSVGDDLETASPYQCSLTLASGDDNLIIASFESISELMGLKSELTHGQKSDALTGLLSHREFEFKINRELSSEEVIKDNKRPIIVFDIDNFQRFNIAYDREGGDQILNEFSRVLSSIFSEDSYIARLNADRFAVYLRKECPQSELTSLIAKVRQRLSSPLNVEFGSAFLTVSIGVDYLSYNNAPARRVIANAEYAVTSAKEMGRNSTRFYSQDISESANHFVRISSELRYAINTRRIVAAYQPIVNASDYTLQSVEALARWNHPIEGVKFPDTFISIAEEAGIMPSLTQAILDRISSDFATLSAKLNYGSISINFSPSLFIDNEFVESFIQKMKKACIPRERLTIEITESTLMRNTANSIAAINTLREAGARVVIDDFGTGYSSLSYLSQFKLDGIKIDKLMVDGVPESKEKAEILKSIVATAKALDLYVVAEGVETAEQAAFLRSAGVNYLQGYYFSRPVLLQDIDFDKSWELYRRPAELPKLNTDYSR
jgi:diguanylate cyclase (GGDEF)-like protein/PAS domain S-box-containing protein